MILGLTGAMRSGKDTVAAYLTEQYGFERLAFADALKGLALSVNPLIVTPVYGDDWRLRDAVEEQGWDEAKKNPEVRRILQELGTGVRGLSPHFWVDYLVEEIDDLDAAGCDIVITDVRFPNEADRIVALGGLIVEVVRPQRPIEGVTNATHVSETAMSPWLECNYSVSLENIDTIEFLHSQIDKLLDVVTFDA